MHMYMHMHMRMHVHTFTCMHARTCTCKCAYAYACMRQVAAIVGSNASLRSLDLSGNSLSEEARRLYLLWLHLL